MPYSFTYNDMRFVFPGYADPGSFFNYCRMGLDLLWEEGKTHPKMMTIGLHARWTGQAACGRLAGFHRVCTGEGRRVVHAPPCDRGVVDRQL
ncbi:MAG: hypothetical protein R2736_05935 [Solirubrobacterales bacterium]